jgi:16S rRNA (guanine527-N7)-methyltransferase
VRPDVTLTLLEATRKKCDFLKAVIADLQLTDVEVINTRAEEAGRLAEHREQYDIALARGVAEMPTLLEYLFPLVKVGGFAVAQKSREVLPDVQRAELALTTLGGRLKDIVPVSVPELNETRYLVVIEKIAATPEKYPRRTGVPSKKPLL